MMQLTPGAFELTIDQSPRPYRGVGIASEIVDFLVNDWVRNGYLISANGGVPTSSELSVLYAIGRQPIDHLDAVEHGAIVGGVDLDWSQDTDVLQNLSDDLAGVSNCVTEYAFSMGQSEMTDA